MVRRMFIIILAITISIFGVNRINLSKTVVTSNYLVLKSIENQNIEEMVNAVRFYIPSFNMSMLHMNSKPYENDDGDLEVYIGDVTSSPGVINEELKTISNNYLFDSTVEFNNQLKQVRVIDNIDLKGGIETIPYTLKGESVYLMTIIPE